jgi:hypothetical protein
VEWNEAFLAGGGLAAGFLVAASILLGPGALTLTAAAVFGAGLPALLLVRPGPAAAPKAAGPRAGLVDATLFSVVVLSLAAFAVTNARYHLLWDGLYIWATKAMLLFDADGLTAELWAGGSAEGRVGRVASYPPLVPLLTALVATLRGAFGFDDGKPVFLLFYASLLAGTFGAGKSLSGRRAGLSAAAIVAALPPLSTRWAAGGYADMPEAAAAVALAGALLRGDGDGPPWRHPAPWLFGAVVAVKSEGSILALVALGGWALGALLAKGPRRALEEVRRNAGGLLVVAAFLGLRLAHARWAATPWDENYRAIDGASLAAAAARAPEVARLVLAEMADVAKWGLLWPALAVASALVLARGDAARRALALATLAATALYASTFLFSNWPAAEHVATALDRILAHLAPMAALVVVAALLPEAAGPAARGEEDSDPAPTPGAP